MITFVQNRDMFNDINDADYAINTVNCNGVMGKGVALGFKKLFPKMFLEYKGECLTGQYRPGDIYIYSFAKPVILNLFTKKNWWEDLEDRWSSIWSHRNSRRA